MDLPNFQNCLLLPQTMFSILTWPLSLACFIRHDLRVSCVRTLCNQATSSLRESPKFLTRSSSLQASTWTQVSISLLQLGHFLLCRGLYLAKFLLTPATFITCLLTQIWNILGVSLSGNFFPPWNQVDLIFEKSGQPFIGPSNLKTEPKKKLKQRKRAAHACTTSTPSNQIPNRGRRKAQQYYYW